MAQLISAIDAECTVLGASVQAVVDAATNEESKAENQYDTRGLEASYLAGAQSERLGELRGIRSILAAMPLRAFPQGEPIGSGAVIELDCDGTRSRCFLLQHAGGYSLLSEGESVLSVTIKSPLGRALMGKTSGDAIEVNVAGRSKEYEILSVY